MIESGQLQVLMALNISDSLSEAAEKLNITQSAVSQNLKALEAKVGFPVVARKGKKVSLTPSGVRLAKLGRNYFKKFDDAITDILQDQNRIKGTIRIGTLFGIGKSWIASRLISFSKLYPDISIEIKMDFSENLLRLFDQYELDIIIVPEKMVPVHSENIILHDESCTLVFPDSNKFILTKDSTLKDVCEYPLIFFEEKDHLFYHFCRERFGSVPRNIKPKLIVNSFGQILQAVSDLIGVAVVPTHVFRRSHYRHVLKTLGKENDILSSRFHFVHHSDDKESLKIKTVLEYLQEEVENLNVE